MERDPKKQKVDDGPTAALFAGDALWYADWQEASGELTLKQRMNTKDPELILFSSWFCPFAQRAWITAEETGINYLWKEINPYYVDSEQPGGYTKKSMTLDEKKTKYPDFIASSPRGLVPAIKHKDISLWESLPVAEYIDAIRGAKLMNRQDPCEAARQHIWCNHCTDRIQKKYYQALVAQEKQTEEAALKEFFSECRMLANAMRDDGPFFNGKEFSMVDIALAPFWQRILIVGGHYMGLKLPTEDLAFQRLETWWQAVRSRPSVAATIVCDARLIASYSDYSKGVATSDAARNYIK
jgi:glutathione S-transferase